MEEIPINRGFGARKILILSCVVHALLFVGVMEVHFSSPVEHGLTQHRSRSEPLTKRMVIFVSDGLRAEGIYDFPDRAPYLNEIRKMHGSWGISHTQVPTESRPGHVAMFAGMYEDPSAITKGWKVNPIDFDHVFNQSANSWLWGSPDIVQMFNKGQLNKIHIDYYHAELEDISGWESTTILDTWVFDKVETFFRESARRGCGHVCDGKNIFFLHLLGMDMAGHIHKPNSKEYVLNLRFVDAKIRETVEMLNNFFGDNQTTYIFTSDHGMTDWGSHGSGTIFETESPFIAWGAGIPQYPLRQDIRQADIATMISSFLGINIPINSVGVIHEKYIDANIETLSHILFANAKQLGEQFNVKRLKMERNTFPIFYKPFVKLAGNHYEHVVALIDYHLQNGKYQDALYESRQLINLIQEGLSYYKFYYKIPTLMCLATGFVLWLVYVGISIANGYQRNVHFEIREPYVSKHTIGNSLKLVSSIVIIIWSFFYVHGVEWKYYAYVTFPFVMFMIIILEMNQLLYVVLLIQRYGFIKFLINGFLFILGVELLVLTFYYREAISLVNLCCILWVWLQNVDYRYKVAFSLTGLITSACVFLPMNLGYWSYCFSGSAAITHCVFLAIRLKNETMVNNDGPRFLINTLLYYIHSVLSLAAFTVTLLSVMYPPKPAALIYFFSWAILFLCLLIMNIAPPQMALRLHFSTSVLYIIYSLMSFSYDGLFLFFFIYMLDEWFAIEYTRVGLRAAHINEPFFQYHVRGGSIYEDFRRSFFYISFILLSYFGAGNIANVNSFDPNWVRCFLGVFSPYTMACLIILKITIPFMIITLFFKNVNALTTKRAGNVFKIVLMLCGIMILNFMFLVQNEGSWLDIGLSISRFAIAIVLILVMVLFYGIAHIISSTALYELIYLKFSGVQEPDEVQNIENIF